MKPGMAVCFDCYSTWDGKAEGSETARVNDPNFKSNPFGLYHTAGNVWEWVQDCHVINLFLDAPNDGMAREEADCDARVVRGGSWISEPGFVRSANRDGLNPVTRFYDSVGFRLAQDIE